MDISTRINQLMHEQRKTGLQLAEATGKTTAAVSKWINGISEPKGDSLYKIAQYLGVTTEYLLYGIKTEIIPIFPWDNRTPLDDDETEVVFYKDYLASCGSGSYSEASV